MGIGIFIGSLSMLLSSYEAEISKSKIEKKAKNYGMHYEDECKVIFSEDVK